MAQSRWLAALVLLSGCEALDPSDSEDAADDTPIFVTPADVSACVPGSLTAAYQASIVKRLNQIRLQHHLPPVAVSSAELAPAQAAALAIVANAKIGHGLSPSEHCYSLEAAQSSAESLLFISAGNQVGDVRDPDRFLGDWLRDVDISNLGHRRWLLDPFVTEVAFGFVQGTPKVDFPYHPVVGAVLHVVDEDEVIDLSWWADDFVAYPFGPYPAELFDKSWVSSFSVVADKTKRLGSVDRVSFDSAMVRVTDDTGSELLVQDAQARYDLMGVPNVLTWRVNGLKDGTSYTVRVSDVLVDESPRDFEYEFVLLP